MHQENDTLVFQRRNHRSDIPVWQVDIKDGSLHSASRDQRHGFPDRALLARLAEFWQAQIRALGDRAA